MTLPLGHILGYNNYSMKQDGDQQNSQRAHPSGRWCCTLTRICLSFVYRIDLSHAGFCNEDGIGASCSLRQEVKFYENHKELNVMGIEKRIRSIE